MYTDPHLYEYTLVFETVTTTTTKRTTTTTKTPDVISPLTTNSFSSIFPHHSEAIAEADT